MEFIVIVLIVGGLLLLSFLQLSNVTGVNRRANIFFGIFTFQWSTFWLDEMVFSELHYESSVFVFVRFFQFLVPISFILSVKFYSNPNTKLVWKDLWLAVVPILFLVLLLFRSVIDLYYFELCYIVIFIGHALFYTVLANVKILRHQKNVELFHSNTEDIDLRWIKYIIYSFISSAVLMSIYSFFTTSDSLNIYINLFFLSVVYLVAYYSIRQKEIYPKGAMLTEVVAGNERGGATANLPKNKLFNERELNVLKDKLLTLMENEKPYLDSSLNLIKLSEHMQISTHQLSYIINAGFGENFFHFVNKYRVRKAAELLTNPRYDHLNIIVIGYEAGFNSKTSFNTTFKKMTAYTPTEYRNNNQGDQA
ncbi:MAG TPA: helix-turn-helix domain-containing protein [Sphingobacterium sp.]|nr:helix-turn-helix domain-containing protein [Sphingobacterium sp.]